MTASRGHLFGVYDRPKQTVLNQRQFAKGLHQVELAESVCSGH
jgi:hypothetical protein